MKEEQQARTGEGIFAKMIVTSKNRCPRVLSVLPLLGQPRYSKRIAMLQQAGFEVEAVAFEREYHSGRLPDCPVESLGRIRHGRYLQRGWTLLRSTPKLRRAMARNQLVYAFGPDMAMAALVAGIGLRRPVVVEVGDIREVLVASGLKGRAARALDRRITAACHLLVVTAPAFLDVYYRQWLRSGTAGLVLENKVDEAPGNGKGPAQSRLPLGRPLENRPLRIGYFGLLRDEWSWKVLECLAVSSPDRVQVLFAGLPIGPLADLPNRVREYPNMQYRGQYRSPQDLPTLYNGVDMVWACYPPIRPDDWNLRWARPNRFYESCLFQKPTLTRAGCHDAVDVQRYNIGMIIDEDDAEQAAARILTAAAANWASWRANMQTLPRHVYLYTNERDILRRTLLRIEQNQPLLHGDEYLCRHDMHSSDERLARHLRPQRQTQETPLLRSRRQR